MSPRIYGCAQGSGNRRDPTFFSIVLCMLREIEHGLDTALVMFKLSISHER